MTLRGLFAGMPHLHMRLLSKVFEASGALANSMSVSGEV